MSPVSGDGFPRIRVRRFDAIGAGPTNVAGFQLYANGFGSESQTTEENRIRGRVAMSTTSYALSVFGSIDVRVVQSNPVGRVERIRRVMK